LHGSLRRNARNWLVNQAKRRDESLNWEEEVWDTSVALLALSHHSEHPESILTSGRDWLSERFRLGNENWNNEPWETSWALLALLALPAVAPHDLGNMIRSAVSWLLTLFESSDNDILVNWHYTALLGIIASRCSSSSFIVAQPDLKLRLEKAADRVAASLAGGLSMKDGVAQIWTKELWSNGLALWALMELHEGRIDDLHRQTTSIVGWVRNTARYGGSHPTEDLAFASIAIFKLLTYLRSRRALVDVSRLCDAQSRSESSAICNLVMQYIETVEPQQHERERTRLSDQIAKRLRLAFPDYAPRLPLWELGRDPAYIIVNLRRTTMKIAL